jgi:uncharacterized damage-inducible protein DinB
MDTAIRDRLLQDYLAGPQQLRQAVQGMTPEQFTARPVPGKMSTLEVICHLSDFEPVYAERMKRAIALEKPSILGADENLFAKKLRYHDRNVEEELKLIDVTRSQMARILTNLPLDAWDREAVHNERGPMTLEKMVTTITHHIPHHVAFIEEKRKALGL